MTIADATTPGSTRPAPAAPEGTASRGTRVLGVLAVAGFAVLALLGLVTTPEDVVQGEAVRLIYVHVPAAINAYLAFGLTALGSAMYLWKRSEVWDLVAGAAAEVGVILTALTLLTGMVWGKTTWGVFWTWDARLTSTALLLVLFLGYLALRRVDAPSEQRSKRAAIAGLIAFVDVPIVHYATEWWRTLHQKATISTLDPQIDGIMLFTLVLGIAVFAVGSAWLLVHRFRLQFVQVRVEQRALDVALAERRAEAAT